MADASSITGWSLPTQSSSSNDSDDDSDVAQDNASSSDDDLPLAAFRRLSKATAAVAGQTDIPSVIRPPPVVTQSQTAPAPPADGSPFGTVDESSLLTQGAESARTRRAIQTQDVDRHGLLDPLRRQIDEAAIDPNQRTSTFDKVNEEWTPPSHADLPPTPSHRRLGDITSASDPNRLHLPFSIQKGDDVFSP